MKQTKLLLKYRLAAGGLAVLRSKDATQWEFQAEGLTCDETTRKKDDKTGHRSLLLQSPLVQRRRKFGILRVGSMMRKKRLLLGMSLSLLFAGTGRVYGNANGAEPVKPSAIPFNLNDVKLLDGPFKERQDINARFLLEVEPDKLLSRFRAQAKLPIKAQPYGGWEQWTLGGHSLGHYLSALAAQYAVSGDERYKQRVDYIVDELALCEKENGDGYVFSLPKQVYEDLRNGKMEGVPFSLNGGGVVNYTLHKVFAGLRDAYRWGGNRKALDIEIKLADWLYGMLCKLTDEQLQKMLTVEWGGMNETLAQLSVDAKNVKYLQMGETFFNHKAIFEPLKNGQDRLNGLHANTQIPKIIGLAEEYELTADPACRTAVETFWKAVAQTRSFVNGGHSEGEHYFPTNLFPDKLSYTTAETCNTHNMIKLTGHLFSWEPKAGYMDFVERGLINHIASNIGHQPGEYGYYLGLKPMCMKSYSTKFDSWWCCVGTGMENPPRYGEQVYFQNGDQLWINLFLASQLTWKEKGLVIRQETRFPDDETVKFTVALSKPQHLSLMIRHPCWCEKPRVLINGTDQVIESQPSSYFRLNRIWKGGEVIEVRLPMKLYTEELPASSGKIQAVKYGPMVLAAVIPSEQGVNDPAKLRYTGQFGGSLISSQIAPLFVTTSSCDFLSGLRPIPGTLGEFRSEGVLKPVDLVFKPFHRVYEEHYSVYFPVYSSEEWKEKEDSLRVEKERKARFDEASIDSVLPGNPQSETDHKARYDKSRAGDHMNRKWRDASDGGWFSYDMAVDAEKPVSLVVSYWGGDEGRVFDILVDGQKLATQALAKNRPGDFFDVFYEIPRKLTAGKKMIAVKFQAPSRGIAGGVYEVRTMKAEWGAAFRKTGARTNR
jgi:DUF1680 family protein